MRKFACMAVVAIAGCCSTKPEVIATKPQEPAVVEAGPVEVNPAPVLVEKQESFIVPEQKPEPVAVVEEKPAAVDSCHGGTLNIVFAVFLCTLAIVAGVWSDYRKKASKPVLPLNEDKPSQG